MYHERVPTVSSADTLNLIEIPKNGKRKKKKKVFVIRTLRVYSVNVHL